MHEALVFVCSRALNADRGMRVMGSVQEDPRLLGGYTEELLKNFRGEVVSASQVRAVFWVCLESRMLSYSVCKGTSGGGTSMHPV